MKNLGLRTRAFLVVLALASGLAFLTSQTVPLLTLSVFFVVVGLGILMIFVMDRLALNPLKTLTHEVCLWQNDSVQKISCPKGHENDEIGCLVQGIQALTAKLNDVLCAERALQDCNGREEQKAQSILEHAGTGIFVLRGDGCLEAWTPAFLCLLGLEAAPPLTGARLSDLLGLSSGDLESWIHGCLIEGKRRVETFRSRDTERWFQMTLDPLAANWVQGLLDDVTGNKLAAELAQAFAMKDSLTGALNRPGVEKLLAGRLPTAFKGVGLLLADLDKFSELNKSYGVEMGDEILRQSVQRMNQVLRKSDVVARLGRDEFLLVVDYLEDEAIAYGIAQKIISALNLPFVVKDGLEVKIGVSIGITLYKAQDSLSWETVFKRADRARYLAKQDGGNCAKLVKN